MSATSGRLLVEPRSDVRRVVPEVPADPVGPWAEVAAAPLVQRADRYAEPCRGVLDGPQPFSAFGCAPCPDGCCLWCGPGHAAVPPAWSVAERSSTARGGPVPVISWACSYSARQARR